MNGLGGLNKSPNGVVIDTYRLPWEDQVKVTDGTSCGFAEPTRMFGARTNKAAE